jgi:hypothetical protein
MSSYGEYWAVVLGPSRSAEDVVLEFDLIADGLDEWLDEAESAAWSAGGLGGRVPTAWEDHHARALGELVEAAFAMGVV